ncbi:MAG: DUF4139 domain-containing protein [Candidatus Marinimicrobia bacterium]|nr:DUF4139 domain-containing protein [Candidatus Neomarinimicrobiota bacterium]
MKANRIFFSIIMCSVFLQVGLSTELFIYNQNMAFIQDQSSLELSNKGDVSFILNGLPENTIPSSILIESDCIDIISHEFIHNPLTLENILESFVGKKIQLVRYGDDGNIASSRDGLLLSTRPSVRFEIDGKIAINPPYSYLFPYIPDDLTENPQLSCWGKASSKKCDIDYSYIATGFDWSTSYSITLDSQQMGDVSAWFLVKNQTRQDFENVDLTLVSGDIAFAREVGNRPKSMARGMEKYNVAMASVTDTQPDMVKTNDYVTFKLPYQVTIPSDEEKQFKYLDKKNIPVKQSYRLEHDMGYRSFRDTNVEDIPVTSTYTIMADDLGEHHQPSGLVRIYEKSNDHSSSVFVGSGNVGNIRKGGEFKIDAGRTQDITATYTVKNIESYKSMTSLENTIVFVNSKDEDVTVDMIERFPVRQKDWEIRKKSHPFEKTDARTAKFTITITAHSTETVSFTADLEN